MWLAVLVAIAALGSLLALYLALSLPPKPALPVIVADSEAVARRRHDAARQEIQTIETVARKMLRAVAASELSASTMLATRRAAVPAQRATVTSGFVWTVGSVAGNSSTGDRVTFYMPFN